MELLSPAGSLERLEYCYMYGADAAYIGLEGFSLRAKADNFALADADAVAKVKARYPGRRLYCALNILFHEGDIARLRESLPLIRRYPIDAFIVQDMGVVPLLREAFPGTPLHLSTQASCVNAEAARVYHSLGFKRIVVGREATLREIAAIKSACPDVEIECFAHGAMCIAYSGRCLMSAYMSGRSAQAGYCSHACRWDYELCAKDAGARGGLALRERSREGEYFPVFEGEGFTALLSSKDLCMIDHLADFKRAGVDSLKIEGRMKSAYYTAVVTRAYRKALDALEGHITHEEAAPFVSELYNVSHRAFSTGFYYDARDADETASGKSKGLYAAAGAVGEPLSRAAQDAVFTKARALGAARAARRAAMHPAERAAYEARARDDRDFAPAPAEERVDFRMYSFEPLNMIRADSVLEMVSPSVPSARLSIGRDIEFLNPETGTRYNWVCNGHPVVIYTKVPVEKGALLRVRTEGEGV